MVVAVVASILFIIPFLLLSLFKDKRRGFIYIVFFLLVFHTALAFFTQLFGVFYYQIILTITILADLGVLCFWFYVANLRQYNFKNISVTSMVSKLLLIDWMILAVITISVASLYQVHYNYTGKISLVRDAPNEYHEVKNMKYPYPYFSDEWYAASFIDYSIYSHHLPFLDPLENRFFLNLEAFTHSFLAGIMLLFGLTPLLSYAVLSVAVNTLIIVLAYTLLRMNAVSKLSAGVASLSILYITSGVNLPGIWNLLPITFGALFCLLIFCFISLSDKKMVFSSFIMASLFYGLLIPFYGFAVLVFLLPKLPQNKETLFNVFKFGLIALMLVIPLGWVMLALSPWGGYVWYLAVKLFYVPFLAGFIHQFNIFYIIPLIVIALAIWGMPSVIKHKKWLAAPLVVGAVYWVAYSFILYRVIIEFERVVFFTSILVILVAGIGLERFLQDIGRISKRASAIVSRYGGILAVIMFLLLVPFYTNRSNWLKLVSLDAASASQGVPRAPANNYFTHDDARIFENIKGKRFLSVPWKGTVIGIATGNHPLVVKAGTMHFGFDGDVDLFSQADCKGKKTMAQEKSLDYIYLEDFDCPSFEKTDKSREGFVLHKVIK